MRLASFRSPLLGALFVAAGLAACGGKVTFVPGSGEGGAGAQGSSSSKISTTTTAASSPVNSSATGTQGFCQAFCAQTGSCIFPDKCVTQCDDITAPPCTSQGENLLGCYQAGIDPDDCSFFGGCEAETKAYNECIGGGPGCTGGICSISEDSCSCQGECQGQNVHAICSLPPDGLPDCTCYIEATPIGSCTETNGEACSLKNGCCAAVLQGDL